ncbi:PCRF domain-containing protein [Tessaracoccus sp.]
MVQVEIRPGEGGADAEAFAQELAAAVVGFARRQSWDWSVRSSTPRLLVVDVPSGNRQLLEQVAGVHRIQRVPANDKRGRRHTSTATVAVMDADGPSTGTILVDGDLRVDRMRGRGRGGQKRNVTESAVRLVHLPTGTTITRLSGRSQIANLADAKRDLAARLTVTNTAAGQAVRDADRRAQLAADGAAKTFTHNDQRDLVVCHRTGRSWSVRAFQQGRWGG